MLATEALLGELSWFAQTYCPKHPVSQSISASSAIFKKSCRNYFSTNRNVNSEPRQGCGFRADLGTGLTIRACLSITRSGIDSPIVRQQKGRNERKYG